jgi:exopolysaccharide biosynthesis polyprenyl glycosylphosphotransferase
MSALTERSPVVEKSSKAWRDAYVSRLAISDFVAVSAAVFASQLTWFGFNHVTVSSPKMWQTGLSGYTTISVLLIVAWMLMLALHGTRDRRVVGHGTSEYKRIIDSALQLFGFIAIVSLMAQIDFSRGYLFIAFPLGVLAIILSRWLWRQWLWAQRRQGRYSARVLIVGSEEASERIAADLIKNSEHGYRVVGACLPTGRVADTLKAGGVPVVGNLDHVTAAMEASGADTVLIASSGELSPQQVRELSWNLESGRQHLIVAPSLTDIGGPRIHMRPVAGLPLIHVETPKYTVRQRFTKRSFDILGSVCLSVILLPVFLVLTVAVKLSSKGPAFYKQERVGRGGRHFSMLKFRSMVIDADDELASLLKEQGTDGTPLFKVQDDPRVTPVGKVLRKYSLDEFPQIFNVLLGDMSLVGPRPQRDGEVALYDEAARRRLNAKPGMSGLWQVSGRSNLTWEDAIRLDLYYVENWSLAGDIAILAKTVREVIAPKGAY